MKRSMVWSSWFSSSSVSCGRLGAKGFGLRGISVRGGASADKRSAKVSVRKHAHMAISRGQADGNPVRGVAVPSLLYQRRGVRRNLLGKGMGEAESTCRAQKKRAEYSPWLIQPPSP